MRLHGLIRTTLVAGGRGAVCALLAARREHVVLQQTTVHSAHHHGGSAVRAHAQRPRGLGVATKNVHLRARTLPPEKVALHGMRVATKPMVG